MREFVFGVGVVTLAVAAIIASYILFGREGALLTLAAVTILLLSLRV